VSDAELGRARDLSGGDGDLLDRQLLGLVGYRLSWQSQYTRRLRLLVWLNAGVQQQLARWLDGCGVRQSGCWLALNDRS
jgi:hypothetical protein